MAVRGQYWQRIVDRINLVEACHEAEVERRPPVFNRRLDPMEALSDVEFKSHFRYQYRTFVTLICYFVYVHFCKGL